MKNTKTAKIAGIGLFTAIVVVLQLLSSVIKFGPFSITLALAPIIIGAALYGVGAGAWLGVAMGVTVLASGDAAAFLTVNAIGTVITVLLKGGVAGMLAGIVFKALEGKNRLLAAICAGITAPLINTGIFLIGCELFFIDTIKTWAGDTNVWTFIITGMVGINFIIELVTNMVLSSAIVKIVDIGKKMLAGKKN
ncbi:MAG: ECF transporter S component [Eubacterium sp.]